MTAPLCPTCIHRVPTEKACAVDAPAAPRLRRGEAVTHCAEYHDRDGTQVLLEGVDEPRKDARLRGDSMGRSDLSDEGQRGMRDAFFSAWLRLALRHALGMGR